MFFLSASATHAEVPWRKDSPTITATTCWKRVALAVDPAGIIQPETIHIMQESGIDISRQTSKGLGDVNLEWMDWVIVLEARLAGSINLPSRKTQQLNWFVTDPIGHPMNVYRAVRDQIQAKVLDFIEMVRNES